MTIKEFFFGKKEVVQEGSYTEEFLRLLNNYKKMKSDFYENLAQFEAAIAAIKMDRFMNFMIISHNIIDKIIGDMTRLNKSDIEKQKYKDILSESIKIRQELSIARSRYNQKLAFLAKEKSKGRL